jgi:hypothetical protein
VVVDLGLISSYCDFPFLLLIVKVRPIRMLILEPEEAMIQALYETLGDCRRYFTFVLCSSRGVLTRIPSTRIERPLLKSSQLDVLDSASRVTVQSWT